MTKATGLPLSPPLPQRQKISSTAFNRLSLDSLIQTKMSPEEPLALQLLTLTSLFLLVAYVLSPTAKMVVQVLVLKDPLSSTLELLTFWIR